MTLERKILAFAGTVLISTSLLTKTTSAYSEVGKDKASITTSVDSSYYDFSCEVASDGMYEGKQILCLENPYLNSKSKAELKTLFAIVEENNSQSAIYNQIQKVVDTLDNARFGNVFEALIEQTYSRVHELAVTEGELLDNEKARKEEYKEFEKDFRLEGVYFSNQGFIGFVFQKGYAVILQIAEPGKEPSEDFGKTKPFFRSGEHSWFGVDYIKPHSYFMGGSPPGPLGKKFIEFVEEKSNLK